MPRKYKITQSYTTNSLPLVLHYIQEPSLLALHQHTDINNKKLENKLGRKIN